MSRCCSGEILDQEGNGCVVEGVEDADTSVKCRSTRGRIWASVRETTAWKGPGRKRRKEGSQWFISNLSGLALPWHVVCGDTAS